MGQFLDKPNTEKESHFGYFFDETCSYGLSSMQGWRVHMEDAHVHATNIPSLPDTAFFAVLDGHGGKTVSTKCAPLMVDAILKSPTISKSLKGKKELTCDDLRDGYREGLMNLDVQVKEQNPELKQGHDRSGSTVISCFMTLSHFIVGNTGDSRIVIGNPKGVKFASIDHKPMDKSERERINNAGGFVEMGRVCGNLAVSRALGDYEYKDRTDLPAEDQKITVNPDMSIIERDDDDTFAIIACDGIWDVMSNEQSIEFVKYYHNRSRTSIEIAELMLDYCLKAGSKDNMSVIVVTLPGAPKPTIRPSGESEEDMTSRIEKEITEVESLLAEIKVDMSKGPPLASKDASSQ
eukprot:m.203887 g.203887  ORF g.203887 m.203887 type:complete len:350 (+) comp13736_c0_seq6:546-1595(+)